jgi:hypothetical protein
MNRHSGYAVGSVFAAILAAGLLGGCAAASGTTSGGGTPSGSGGTTGGVLILPSAPTTSPGSDGGGSAPTTAASQPGGGGPATAAGVPQCRTPDLSGEANIVAGSAAAGHITMNITVTNTSGHTCTIFGFPGLALEDTNQDVQPTKVTWDPAVAKTLITLANGASASSSAQLDKDLPVGSEPLSGPCEPASFYLQITPPNNTSQLVASIGDTGGAGITVCDFGALDVLAFVPGSTGPHE